MLFDGPEDAVATVVLAHGAGAGMDTPFLDAYARGLAETGLRVARFEFPYMQRRRAEGTRRPPDRMPKLLDAYRAAIEALGGPESLVIGGKSMGGRVASMLADEAGVAGLLCLGYPFHPPGKPEKLRTAHLLNLETRALVVQGTRDPFGKPDEVGGYGLAPTIRVAWIEDGDHSLRPPARSPRTLDGNLAEAIAVGAAFVHDLDAAR